ncbi:gamma-glutamyltransferase family protein [Alkalicoccus daliensis]|uniref:Gamma-glutamyltransferase 1. Threonine peptidase. MEROPS family T03 n=1 Tax=Alkalicoccus daliensis TaxID=745820 RepID=A0A1H0KKA2_9BACI|nr:gamma-glutamyltransferase family protein [Alkalicoccus daliensis]SDO56388.1 gamma-glutamyltransferase 1 . Threonine peptidase. MEROPS family T03 [Alkalicoccus daliensis]
MADARPVSTASSNGGMVSTASSYATRAGVEMLNKGGNAVDAAAAAAFCLGVSEPQASGIGGQSMALIHLQEEGRSFTLDGSSRAPYVLSPEKNPVKPIKLGLRSSTVPSTPAAIGYMQETYGKLSLAEVLAPAIQTAREGITVSRLLHRMIVKEAEQLRKDPLIFKNYFSGRKPLAEGALLQQSELADTLEEMAEKGWRDFYTGGIGQRIIEDMKKRNGLITEVDLHQIPMPVERGVLESSYREYDIVTYPPPGAGRVLVQILNTLEGFEAEELDPDQPLGAVILALAFRFALNYRQRMPVHPDHYFQSLTQELVDKNYADEIIKRIKEIYHLALKDTFVPPPTSGETTHLSVVDKDGNAVGVTQSIELVFGSKKMAAGLGFFYNNYMSAFEYKDVTHPYYLLPGGRPWSSVAPVLLLKKGRPQYLLGSPGSARISTTLAQVITRLVDQGESLEAAIAAPRFHASDAGELMIEKERFSMEVNQALRLASFKITKRDPYSFYLGCVQGVQMPVRWLEQFQGVADPRRDGTAQGPE